MIIPGGTDRQTEDKGYKGYSYMQETQAGSANGKTDRWGVRQGAEQVSKAGRQAGRPAGRQVTFQIMRGCHRLRGQVP